MKSKKQFSRKNKSKKQIRKKIKGGVETNNTLKFRKPRVFHSFSNYQDVYSDEEDPVQLEISDTEIEQMNKSRKEQEEQKEKQEQEERERNAILFITAETSNERKKRKKRKKNKLEPVTGVVRPDEESDRLPMANVIGFSNPDPPVPLRKIGPSPIQSILKKTKMHKFVPSGTPDFESAGPLLSVSMDGVDCSDCGNCTIAGGKRKTKKRKTRRRKTRKH